MSLNQLATANSSAAWWSVKVIQKSARCWRAKAAKCQQQFLQQRWHRGPTPSNIYNLCRLFLTFIMWVAEQAGSLSVMWSSGPEHNWSAAVLLRDGCVMLWPEEVLPARYWRHPVRHKFIQSADQLMVCVMSVMSHCNTSSKIAFISKLERLFQKNRLPRVPIELPAFLQQSWAESSELAWQWNMTKETCTSTPSPWSHSVLHSILTWETIKLTDARESDWEAHKKRRRKSRRRRRRPRPRRTDRRNIYAASCFSGNLDNHTCIMKMNGLWDSQSSNIDQW